MLNVQWYETGKQNVLTFESLEPANIWVFSLTNDLNNYSMIKIGLIVLALFDTTLKCFYTASQNMWDILRALATKDKHLSSFYRFIHNSPLHCLVTRIHYYVPDKLPVSNQDPACCLHPRYRLAGQPEACSGCMSYHALLLPMWTRKCVISECAQYILCMYVSVIHQSLTCNSYYDVLRRAALTITLLDRRVLDVRGYIVLRGSGQNHCLLALGLGGRRLRTKCILSCFWGSGWLVSWCDGSRGWWDLGQEVCRLCGWGWGGSRCCYGYCVGLLRLKVLRVSRSCHGNQCLKALALWIKRDSTH